MKKLRIFISNLIRGNEYSFLYFSSNGDIITYANFLINGQNGFVIRYYFGIPVQHVNYKNGRVKGLFAIYRHKKNDINFYF